MPGQAGDGIANTRLVSRKTHLVEFQNIEQLEQFPVFLRVLQLDVVLSQSVQGQLGLVIDVDLHRL